MVDSTCEFAWFMFAWPHAFRKVEAVEDVLSIQTRSWTLYLCYRPQPAKFVLLWAAQERESMSSKCCQHQLRAVGATRFGIVHSRPGRISRRILDHNVAGCDAADSQFVPHCAAGHQATLTSVELSEETSQSARRALLRIAWALGSVALGVLAVSVACGIQGSSGLLATVAGTITSTWPTSSLSPVNAAFLQV